MLENPAQSPPKPPGTSVILFLSLLENNGSFYRKARYLIDVWQVNRLIVADVFGLIDLMFSAAQF